MPHVHRANKTAQLADGNVRESCYCGARRLAGNEEWLAYSPRTEAREAAEHILQTFRDANTHPINCSCRVCILCRYVWDRRRRG